MGYNILSLDDGAWLRVRAAVPAGAPAQSRGSAPACPPPPPSHTHTSTHRSDVMVMDDPYRFFKAPPFDNITLLAQNDGLGGAINCGVMYRQASGVSDGMGM